MNQKFVGGRWLPARDGRVLPVVDPFNAKTYEQFPRGSPMTRATA